MSWELNPYDKKRIDKHKPTAASFKKHLNIDGTLNNEYRNKIKKYAL